MEPEVKVLGVIPARIGSTRLPKKPLADLLGKSVIERVFLNMRQAKSLSMLAVATDSDEIKAVCEKAGAMVVMTSSEHQSGSDRVFEASNILSGILAKGGAPFDIVVNIQGDLPFLKGQVVDQAVSLLKESQSATGIATVGTPIFSKEEFERPSSVKIVCGASNQALYFSRSPVPHGAASPPFGLRHLGLYAYKREALKAFTSLPPSKLELQEKLEQLRALENGIGIAVATVERSLLEPNIEIDTPSDVEKAIEWLRANPHG